MKLLEHIPKAVGLDEAGRGPLAGPVVAAAVMLPDDFDCRGLNDSKQLDAAKREELEIVIKERAYWRVCFVHHEEIDELNILWASMAAMERAFFDLQAEYGAVYVDGNKVPRRLLGRAEAVVKGDGKLACVAAASILAKTARDRYMREIAAEYPLYGFQNHFGYPTPEHFAALREHGPCPIHRKSFAPVAECLQGVLAF